MFGQTKIRAPKDTPLPQASTIEPAIRTSTNEPRLSLSVHLRDFFTFPSDAPHARAVLAFKTRFDSRQPSESRRHSAQDPSRHVVIGEQQDSPSEPKRARELRSEEEEVQGGLENVPTTFREAISMRREETSREGDGYGLDDTEGFTERVDV